MCSAKFLYECLNRIGFLCLQIIEAPADASLNMEQLGIFRTCFTVVII